MLETAMTYRCNRFMMMLVGMLHMRFQNTKILQKGTPPNEESAEGGLADNVGGDMLAQGQKKTFPGARKPQKGFRLKSTLNSPLRI